MEEQKKPDPIEFSVIVPWRGGNLAREQSLYNMLNCLSVQELPDNLEPIVYELIIVEQCTESNSVYSRQKTLALIPEKIVDLNYIQAKIDNSDFNKSWCMNIGARNAKYKHLLFVDADSLFGKDYFKTIKYFLRAMKPPMNKIVFCWNYLIGLIGKDNPIARHIRPDTTMAMGAIWYAEKDFYFNEFGGMNENYFGYGGEDNDAYERACFAMNVPAPSTIPYPLAHQYHDWEVSSPRAVNYFEITKRNPKIIIDRLRMVDLGKLSGPSLISVEDLVIN